MATLNFPDNPSTGDEYYDSNAGFNYEWNGTVWITKDLATPNNIREIDDISSGFDGSDTTFTLQVNGVNIAPLDVKQLVISVGGVMQNPGDDYTVSGSTLTFTSAPSSGLSFVGTFLGAAASLNTISAGSVSPSSLTTTSNYTVGSIKVSGASTIGNFVLTGLTTIADPDVTNFNSSGVGTVSNVILTGDNSGLGATIGSAVGVVTYFGDGFNMTGVGLSIFPLVYGPGIGSTQILKDTNITTTWNYPIQAGSGTITIRTGSGSGTIVDQFVVGSSSSITISERTLTLNPAADLATGTEHFVVYPAGAIKSTSGQKENNQLITSFTTKPLVKELFVSGKSDHGSLGLNQPSNTSVSSPTQIPGTTWNNVYTFGAPGFSDSIMVTKTDGTLWSWGYNSEGMLGLNDQVSRSSPTQIPGTTWKEAGGLASYLVGNAIKTDGTLWGWGRPYYGGNTNIKVSSPVQIGTDTTWDKIGGSASVKTDGTAWVWGTATQGRLGLNQGPALAGLSSPTQIPGTNWSDVFLTELYGMGVKTNGQLWTWGNVQYLGQNTGGTNHRSSPVQIPGTTWASVSGTYNTAFATKTDGSLWGWGSNYQYQLGQNALSPSPQAYYSSPIQIGTDTTWSTTRGHVSRGGWWASGAIKTDGTLWRWGRNNQGINGTNTTSPSGQSSPTQIPGNWSSTAAAQRTSYQVKES